MKMDDSRFLFLLFLIIPFFLLERRRFHRRVGNLFALIRHGNHRSETELQRELRSRYILSNVFFASSLALIIIALAGPRWGERLVSDYRRGLDITLAFDVSRSMEVQDIVPSRLGRAAELAQDLVQGSPGIRFAIALGKGNGIVAVPLTDDAESTQSLLGALSSSTMSSSGTDLEQLIDAARSAFPSSSPSRRLIILFSDGEALSGSLQAAADRAALEGIILSTVGLGTLEGGLVPANGGQGKQILSSLREAELRKAASRALGIYIDGKNPGALREVLEYIGQLSTATAQGFRRESRLQSPLFLALALLFFAASKFIENLPRRPR
ncbi:VWA domain-containing protein [Treponema sp.]